MLLAAPAAVPITAPAPPAIPTFCHPSRPAIDPHWIVTIQLQNGTSCYVSIMNVRSIAQTGSDVVLTKAHSGNQLVIPLASIASVSIYNLMTQSISVIPVTPAQAAALIPTLNSEIGAYQHMLAEE
jgi:hypothetical protein